LFAHACRAARAVISLVAATMLAVAATAPAAQADGQFTTLQSGFTQELYGISPAFMGGVAFAPDGDPIVDDCSNSGSPIRRFDKQTLLPPTHGTSTLHPRTDISSNAGCGLTQVGGFLYTNTSGGVVKLDPDTGATLAGPFGPGGDALGITVDPTNQRLVYVGSNGTLYSVNQALNDVTTFSTALTGHFVDGIFFNEDGSFLFAADRSGPRLAIIRHDGTLAQGVPTSSEPDGIVFHASSPKFVLSSNTDGTITRYDFPGDDYTQTPTQSQFASGGFRGDLAQVGNDGCAYFTQDGTRYDDGTTSGDDSLVRICSGFVPPAGVEGPAGAANCSDNVDNDGDGKVDQQDPDCQSPEGPQGDPSCSDNVDNDGDGKVDANDPDCQGGGGGGGGTNPCDQPGVIHGTNGPDTINGTPGDDVICAGAGDDTVNGKGGNDKIFGQGGNDALNGNIGKDQISGGQGNDKLNGGAGDDTLNGGVGDDRIVGGTGNDRANGGTGADSINGNTGNDRLDGAAGDDTLRGGGDDDVLIGSDGNDTLSGGNGNDRASGGSGNDTINGDAGNDDLRGNTDDDVITGDGGDDNLRGNAGNDRLDGGDGNDRASGDAGDDTVLGGDGNDTLLSGSGIDKLSGQGGNDHLNTDDGAPGDNAACGGGTDKAVVNAGDSTSSCETVVVH
jgi:Ca2+-binding RTX toxin-like protein